VFTADAVMNHRLFKEEDRKKAKAEREELG
jgi:hypothetical protein